MIEKIMNISGNSYEWNETMKDLTGRTGVHHGVLFQEVQKEFPEMVIKGNDGYLRVDYIQLIPVMIEAIKELKQEIDQLKQDK